MNVRFFDSIRGTWRTYRAGSPLEVDPPATAHVAWTGSRLLRDGEEAGAYHIVVGFEAVVT